MSDLRISEETINNIIREEVVKKLGGESNTIEAILKIAIHYKYKHHDKPWLEECAIRIILDKAEDIFKEWLHSNSDTFKAKLIERLNSTMDERVEEVCQKIISRIAYTLFNEKDDNCD